MSNAVRIEAEPRNAALFWWATLGAAASGISLFSLTATYWKLGLVGVAGAMHREYSELRSAIFDNLETFVPFLRLTDTERALVMGVAIFVGVCARTYLLAKKSIPNQGSGDSVLLDVLMAIV